MTYLGTQCKDKLLEYFILLQQLSPRKLIEKASPFVERQKSSEVRVVSIFSAQAESEWCYISVKGD